MEAPPEDDGSGSQWPDWPEWPQSTVDSMGNTTPAPEPTESTTAKAAELPPVNPELPELPGLPLGEMTLPPVPVSPTMGGEKALGNLETNANDTLPENVEELNRGEQVETPQVEERVNHGQQEELPDIILPTTSSPSVKENVEPVVEDATKSSVNKTVLNVNTTPQTTIPHEQESNEEILPDSSRTEMKETISQVATNETVTTNVEENANLQNEKVTSVEAKAWPDAKHVHDKMANEVVKEDDETPTEAFADQVTNVRNPVVTDVKEVVQTEGSKNEVIRQEKVNGSPGGFPSEQPKPSTKSDQILPGKTTGISPIKPTEHQGNLDQPNGSLNQSQEQPKYKDKNNYTQDLEADFQGSDQSQQQQEIEITEQPDLQKNAQGTGQETVSSGPSEKPLAEDQVPVTETVMKEDSQQDEFNNTQIVVEPKQDASAPTTVSPRNTEEFHQQEEATDTRESAKPLGGNVTPCMSPT